MRQAFVTVITSAKLLCKQEVEKPRFIIKCFAIQLPKRNTYLLKRWVSAFLHYFHFFFCPYWLNNKWFQNQIKKKTQRLFDIKIKSSTGFYERNSKYFITFDNYPILYLFHTTIHVINFHTLALQLTSVKRLLFITYNRTREC